MHHVQVYFFFFQWPKLSVSLLSVSDCKFNITNVRTEVFRYNCYLCDYSLCKICSDKEETSLRQRSVGKTGKTHPFIWRDEAGEATTHSTNVYFLPLQFLSKIDHSLRPSNFQVRTAARGELHLRPSTRLTYRI